MTPAEADVQKADDIAVPATAPTGEAVIGQPSTRTTAPTAPDQATGDRAISPTDPVQDEEAPVAPAGLNVAEERQYYADYLKKHFGKDAEPNWTAAEIQHLIEELRSGGSGK